MSENVTQINESRALVVVEIEVLTENVSNRGVPPCAKNENKYLRLSYVRGFVLTLFTRLGPDWPTQLLGKLHSWP